MVIAIGQYAGMAIVFAAGGTFAVAAGGSPDGWRSVLLWLSVPLLLAMFSMLLMSEPPRAGYTGRDPSTRKSLVELVRYRKVVLPIVAGLVLAETAVGAVTIWGAPTLARNFGLRPDRIGAIMAVGFVVSGLTGPLVGGVLADLAHRSGGPRRAIAVLAGLVALSVPASLFSVAPQMVSATLLLICLMTIIGGIVVMGTALLTVVLPNELRGTCMAALSAASVLFGAALAPVMVSTLSGALGGPAMIGRALTYFCVTAGILGTAVLALAHRADNAS
jgi:MFS family permease